MLRKIIVVLIASIMVFALSACGGNNNTESDGNASSNNSSSKSSDDGKTIDMEGMLLAEDDNIKIELVGLFEKEVNWTHGAAVEKGFTIKIYNKGNRKMHCDLEDVYLGDESATLVMETGTPTPVAGKSVTSSYLVQHEGQPHATPLDSFDDLKSFECNVEYSFYTEDESMLEDGGSVHFDFTSIK